MKKTMKTVAALMLMMAVVCAAGCKKQEPSSGSYNGHEYVDLGLPSGTMWATSNVDASNAKGYAYFAWGETQTKTTYTWDTYKWGSEFAITKYCPRDFALKFPSCVGDDLTVLEPEDDAATVLWGEGWRIPTHEDWQELVDNCTYEWTGRNGINGMLFTASNGNTLFLPAAGEYNLPGTGDDPESGGLFANGRKGCYWSSSVYLCPMANYNVKHPHNAYMFSISEITGPNYYNSNPRLLGYTIRPVHSAN